MDDRHKYYQLDKQVGSGAFAGVSRAFHLPSSQLVAIKSVPISILREKKWFEHFHQEVKISESCDHPFIIRIFDFFEKNDSYHLVMEYLEMGDFLNFVNLNEGIKEPQAKRFFLQLVLAIEYLHEEIKVAHRDIKLENILLDKQKNLRLIDFGFSKALNDEPLNTRCGSPSYTAPEILISRSYGKEVDIWGLGVILYAMVTGTLPFYDQNLSKQFDKIKNEEPEYPSELNSDLIDLLSKLLKKNPTERITIPDIKKHSWFEEGSFEKMESCIKSSYEIVNEDERTKSFISDVRNRKDLPEHQKDTLIKIFMREKLQITLWKKNSENGPNNGNRMSVQRIKSCPLGVSLLKSKRPTEILMEKKKDEAYLSKTESKMKFSFPPRFQVQPDSAGKNTHHVSFIGTSFKKNPAKVT